MMVAPAAEPPPDPLPDPPDPLPDPPEVVGGAVCGGVVVAGPRVVVVVVLRGSSVEEVLDVRRVVVVRSFRDEVVVSSTEVSVVVLSSPDSDPLHAARTMAKTAKAMAARRDDGPPNIVSEGYTLSGNTTQGGLDPAWYLPPVRAYVVGALLGWLVGAILIGGILDLTFGSRDPGSESTTVMIAVGGVVGVSGGLFLTHRFLRRRLARATDKPSGAERMPSDEEVEPIPAWFGRAFLGYVGYILILMVVALALGRIVVDDVWSVLFRFGAFAFWFFVGLALLTGASRSSGPLRYVLGSFAWIILGVVVAASLVNVGLAG